jgi:hypothetical protein
MPTFGYKKANDEGTAWAMPAKQGEDLTIDPWTQMENVCCLCPCLTPYPSAYVAMITPHSIDPRTQIRNLVLTKHNIT